MDPYLPEAHALIAALIPLRESLALPDRRLLFSWRHYLKRMGDGARVGSRRIGVLREVAAQYGIVVERTVVPEVVVEEIEPVKVPWGLERVLRDWARMDEKRK